MLLFANKTNSLQKKHSSATCGAGTDYPSRAEQLGLHPEFVLLEVSFSVQCFIDRWLNF
jgi:hypothetical protein